MKFLSLIPSLLIVSIIPVARVEDSLYDYSTRLSCNQTRYMTQRESIVIQSPGFGGTFGYPASSVCWWNIHSSSCNLKISCSKFRLNDLFCLDYVDIQKFDKVTKRFCGLRSPNMELGPAVNVRFVSTYMPKFPYTGFRCRIECKLQETTSGVETSTKPSKRARPSSNCTCGKAGQGRSPRIINGTDSFLNEFRWMAALINKNESLPFCGGSIINDRYILTAAHCVEGKDPSSFQVSLKYDSKNLNNSRLNNKFSYLSIDQVIVHSKYNNLRLDYDAALLRLKESLDLSLRVNVPVCLPSIVNGAPDYELEVGTVIGWGLTDTAGWEDNNTPLQKVNITVLGDSLCRELYPMRKIKPEKLCAYAPYQDSCEGDSGGPLMLAKQVKKDKIYTHIGIVSSGVGCAQVGKPGLYIRTTELVSWINIAARDGSFCGLNS